ncbi:DUF6745 domain-containing protein [Nonomuraea rhizosphaerae]|uniref:DUF6745 domain-containing protein n=1 Tax=Nonomuraea rhizosphaerae TaxID=2665663 RepID=UPI001C5CF0A5|nr:hypothetical protein [Nonomuraea rhizosphaerae]
MSVLAQRDAAAIREEWLGSALSTLPADRPAAEAAISGLYRLIGLAPPRFHWVTSPLKALVTVPPGAGRETLDRMAQWPVPRQLSALVTKLCLDLDVLARRFPLGWEQPIRRTVRASLSRSVNSALLMPLRAAHDTPYPQASNWYGVQCVSWLAHYDALRRTTGVTFSEEQNRQLDLWAAVARSCGWWWPREGVCVVSERPSVLHTEVWGDDGEVRLHCAYGPAVRYADGWDMYAWHGTRVPPWVITDPDVDRITREPNVEVRRCAIEHVGWPAYIDRAGLRLVATAPDPGNPGSELRLFDMRAGTRVLLAVNGSVERDGLRRRYGLTVPGSLDDPVAAAAWTYGLSAHQYAQLVRRT